MLRGKLHWLVVRDRVTFKVVGDVPHENKQNITSEHICTETHDILITVQLHPTFPSCPNFVENLTVCSRTK